MSEESKNIEKKTKFHRGTALTIFKSDRYEDLIALVLSLLIALGVYFFVK
jgi:hypothetical protein